MPDSDGTEEIVRIDTAYTLAQARYRRVLPNLDFNIKELETIGLKKAGEEESAASEVEEETENAEQDKEQPTKHGRDARLVSLNEAVAEVKSKHDAATEGYKEAKESHERTQSKLTRPTAKSGLNRDHELNQLQEIAKGLNAP